MSGSEGGAGAGASGWPKAAWRLGALGRRGVLSLGAVLVAGAAAGITAGCASAPDRPSAAAAPLPPPIVFVHGNGDSAALWLTTIWRFESNGYPRERLHAIDLPYPLARDADDQPQPGRTSAAEHWRFLAAEVDKVLASSGAQQVVLMGNSRGGNAIRNYVMNGGGAKVSHAILGGTPNRGIWVDAAWRPTNEFNGAGPVLRALNNQGAPGVEIAPGPTKWLTIRSDRNDKFTQPEGEWIGARGRPTNVGFDTAELNGALNVVLPGIDHRETAYGPLAFAAAWRFITGREPALLEARPEPRIVLDGVVSGQGLNNDPTQGSGVTNLPLAGATVEVYATDAGTGERRGAAVWRKTVGADGRWGPMPGDSATAYEFVVAAPGYAVAHFYRSPFARSSSVAHLRAQVLAAADRGPGSVVTLTRPRGYFGVGRDTFSLDGAAPAPGIPPGVPGLAASRVKLAAAPERAIAGEFNGERIVGRTWPADANHLVFLELHR